MKSCVRKPGLTLDTEGGMSRETAGGQELYEPA